MPLVIRYSVDGCQRDNVSAPCLVLRYANGMAENDAWRSRLVAAIEQASARDPALSERQIGIRAGVGQSWVSDFKNGGKEPKVDTLLKVCAVLGVSPVYILTGARITPAAEELVSLFAGFDPDRQRKLVDFVQSFEAVEKR